MGFATGCTSIPAVACHHCTESAIHTTINIDGNRNTMATIVSTSTTQLILTGIEYEIAKLKFPIGSTTQFLS